MKKIQRLTLTMAGLLLSLASQAYTITIVPTEAEKETYHGYITASATTDITAGTTITLTVTPNANYYFDNLQREEVTDLGSAEAPRRVPSVGTITPMYKNNAYASVHFGGSYTFNMPENDVIITATFIACKDITNDDNITFALNGSNIYDGTTRGLVVSDNAKDGADKTITLNLDYNNIEWTYPAGSETVKNAGTYRATITGIGMYTGTKTSGDLIISNKTLNVTAVAKSKIFGEADPALTYTYEGLLNGDEITGDLTRDPGEDKGSYNIQQGTLAATNYFISYTASTLTINPKNIGSTATITPSAIYYNYDANNDQKATITSVKDGETTLINGTDYDYAYSSEYYPTEGENNRRADIHYITVTFKGNYTGSKAVEYQIRKDVTMSYPYRWRTYYETEVNMRVPAGFKAYTLNHVGATQAVLDECLYIKKDEPMLLYRIGDAYDNFFPEVVKKDDANLVIINSDETIFKYTTSNTVVSDLLSANSGKDIWILVNDEFVRTESGTIPAYKCYLVLEKNSVPVPVLPIVRRDITGIKSIDNGQLVTDNEVGAWYSIDGCRLNGKPAKKGIYINQGKKIVIK